MKRDREPMRRLTPEQELALMIVFAWPLALGVIIGFLVGRVTA